MRQFLTRKAVETTNQKGEKGQKEGENPTILYFVYYDIKISYKNKL
jgi:hypothetical protein